jgi:hypothetical protein
MGSPFCHISTIGREHGFIGRNVKAIFGCLGCHYWNHILSELVSSILVVPSQPPRCEEGVLPTAYGGCNVSSSFENFDLGLPLGSCRIYLHDLVNIRVVSYQPVERSLPFTLATASGEV